MRTMRISTVVVIAALCGWGANVAPAQVGYVFSDGLGGLEARQEAQERRLRLDEILKEIAARNSTSQQTTVLPIHVFDQDVPLLPGMEQSPETLAARMMLSRAQRNAQGRLDPSTQAILDKLSLSARRSYQSTLYCIRIYPYDANGNPTLSTNPNVLPDGVLGYAIRDASVFDPPSDAKPATPPPAADAKPAVKPAAPVAQPTLDDLLGIKPKPGDKPATATTPTPADPGAAGDGAPDQSKADLDRLLSAQEMSDAFKQAIALMGDASKRMNEHADNGLGTQRVQEDVVKRLDQLLASLDKQKQQGSGSPKPSPKNEDSQQDPSSKPKPKPGEGKGQKPQQGGDGMQSHDGPTLQEGQLKPELESARAAWGSLPARIRAMLMQGTEDRFSSRYKALTQEYYKRLAEENSK